MTLLSLYHTITPQFLISNPYIPIVTASSSILTQNVNFKMGVKSSNDIPNKYGDGDIAFSGRSNVGKSSLLNSIFKNNNLARVSNTPGRTQELNFFTVGKIFRVVDLPGYGFAKKSPKDHADEWQRLIGYYITEHDLLKKLYVLIDCRRGLTPIDIQFMSFLNQNQQPFKLVLTKHDKVKSKEFDFLLAQIRLFVLNKLPSDNLFKYTKLYENGKFTAETCKLHFEPLPKYDANSPELDNIIKELIEEYNKRTLFRYMDPYVHVTSAETKFGLQEIRNSIGKLFNL